MHTNKPLQCAPINTRQILTKKKNLERRWNISLKKKTANPANSASQPGSQHTHTHTQTAYTHRSSGQNGRHRRRARACPNWGKDAKHRKGKWLKPMCFTIKLLFPPFFPAPNSSRREKNIINDILLCWIVLCQIVKLFCALVLVPHISLARFHTLHLPLYCFSYIAVAFIQILIASCEGKSSGNLLSRNDMCTVQIVTRWSVCIVAQKICIIMCVQFESINIIGLSQYHFSIWLRYQISKYEQPYILYYTTHRSYYSFFRLWYIILFPFSCYFFCCFARVVVVVDARNQKMAVTWPAEAYQILRRRIHEHTHTKSATVTVLLLLFFFKSIIHR